MTPLLQRWSPRLLTLLVWALVAASVAQWSLRWGSNASSAAVNHVALAPATGGPALDSAALARLLGSASTGGASPVASAARHQLTGVVAATPSGRGAALIATDGKPARAYPVGSKVEDGLYLVAVGPRQAQLGGSVKGPTTISLELPPKK